MRTLAILECKKTSKEGNFTGRSYQKQWILPKEGINGQQDGIYQVCSLVRCCSLTHSLTINPVFQISVSPSFEPKDNHDQIDNMKPTFQFLATLFLAIGVSADWGPSILLAPACGNANEALAKAARGDSCQDDSVPLTIGKDGTYILHNPRLFQDNKKLMTAKRSTACAVARRSEMPF